MPEIEQELKQINPIIMNNIKPTKGKLGEALQYTFSTTGKQLRPALALEFGQLEKSQLNKKLLNIAASIEVLHNATLIHDDIIDESPRRHGKTSIQKKYGKQIAVYAGDYLFALSLQLLSGNTSKITNLRMNSNAMRNILAGETAQFGNEFNIKITERDYLNQIKGKTAILFGYSCFIGALEGGLSRKQAKIAEKIGENIGMAFQLKDDVLDYTSKSDILNKPVLADIVNGIYTGPLIFALKNDENDNLLNLVQKGKKINKTDLSQINHLVQKYGGIKSTEALANQYTNKALHLLKNDFDQYQRSKNIEWIINKLFIRNY
ncbi:heptaprenyl diphosphate synthase [Lactobacillus colini]|uniref:Heptaprenyl diphosphate synthase n=1 Tax=Lactobacillus colini TaxID=1819254 RepID=A0ABS4MEG8_9LACO|nr:polyprenyl synthetase family protein [Lactobacillus colini]MBP2057751.1 heptaprenyl diphosphate synthase [Lactobacillus colini]